jgi:DNA-binding XRE family transcriptional regulator
VTRLRSAPPIDQSFEESEFAMAAKRAPGPSRATDKAAEELRTLVGINFRRARLKANLTQADVEQLTGIRQHYISEIERGLRNLTLDTMSALATVTGTDIRALLRRPSKKG